MIIYVEQVEIYFAIHNKYNCNINACTINKVNFINNNNLICKIDLKSVNKL